MRTLLVTILLCFVFACSCSSSQTEVNEVTNATPSFPTPDYQEIERVTTGELTRVCGLSSEEAFKLVDETTVKFNALTGHQIDRQGAVSLFLAIALKAEKDRKSPHNKNGKVDCSSIAKEILDREARTSEDTPQAQKPRSQEKPKK